MKMEIKSCKERNTEVMLSIHNFSKKGKDQVRIFAYIQRNRHKRKVDVNAANVKDIQVLLSYNFQLSWAIKSTELECRFFCGTAEYKKTRKIKEKKEVKFNLSPEMDAP